MFTLTRPLLRDPAILKILPYRILFSYCRAQPSVPHSIASFYGVILQNCGRLFYLINSGCSLLILLFPESCTPHPRCVSWLFATAACVGGTTPIRYSGDRKPLLYVRLRRDSRAYTPGLTVACARRRLFPWPSRLPQILLYDPFVVFIYLLLSPTVPCPWPPRLCSGGTTVYASYISRCPQIVIIFKLFFGYLLLIIY